MKRFLLCGLAAIAMVVGSSTAHAGFIVRNGVVGQNGTGYGAIETIMSLQASGGNPNDPLIGQQGGSVTWNGTQDVITGLNVLNNGNDKTQTLTVATLNGLGITSANNNMTIVFQANMAGNVSTMNLFKFTLVFQDSSGATYSTLTWDSTSATDNPGGNNGPGGQPLGGVGAGSSGHRFDVTLTGSELSFLNNPLNRLGFIVDPNITNANDGPDYFYVQGREPTVNPVPAPPALLLAVTGVGCMGLYRRFRKAKTVA
jgi:hypothetical protein